MCINCIVDMHCELGKCIHVGPLYLQGLCSGMHHNTFWGKNGKNKLKTHRSGFFKPTNSSRCGEMVRFGHKKVANLILVHFLKALEMWTLYLLASAVS